MRYTTAFFLAMLVTALGAATYLLLRGFGIIGTAPPAQVLSVPAGHQEIAFISPASETDTWERLVEAARRLQADELQPLEKTLHLDLERAFVDQSAAVPEIALWPSGSENARLWIRWYKTSSGATTADWVRLLASSPDRPAPLAILGGGSTRRALEVLEALDQWKGRWPGNSDPLFLITTATADAYRRSPEDENRLLTDPDMPQLMRYYPGRTFRFAFTNRHMVDCVIKFVRQQPRVWLEHYQEYNQIGSILAATNPLSAALFNYAVAQNQPRYSLYWVAWKDDSYSEDLAARFADYFRHNIDLNSCDGNYVVYSTGDSRVPNPREMHVAWQLVDQLPRQANQRMLLVLPTAAARARRFLRSLVRIAPVDIRNLVVLNGDSMGFDEVYRDRMTSWNIIDVPVPLVFFSHRNPIDKSLGFQKLAPPNRPWLTTGTQNLLLFRDIHEALIRACYRQGLLVSNPDQLRSELVRLRWWGGRPWSGEEGQKLFDHLGNREAGTGEHIIWLQPQWEGRRVLASARLHVYRLVRTSDQQMSWELEEWDRPDPLTGERLTLQLYYNQPVEVMSDPPALFSPQR